MINWYGQGMGYGSGFSLAMSFLVVVLLWSIFWKGLALWHAALRGKPWWFCAFLVFNTVGILEIVYLFGFAKVKWNELFTSKH